MTNHNTVHFTFLSREVLAFPGFLLFFGPHNGSFGSLRYGKLNCMDKLRFDEITYPESHVLISQQTCHRHVLLGQQLKKNKKQYF